MSSLTDWLLESSTLFARKPKSLRAMSSRVGQFGQISTINDHLCLSGSGVLKAEKIKEKKITCIVNATTEEPSAPLPGVDYLKVRVDDAPQANLHAYFDLVADKIRQTKEAGGRTLVHCVAGVSRSASLCIVYLIKHTGLSLRQAYFHVKAARPIIHPNPGFWKQMIEYELRLTGRNSVKLRAMEDGGDIPDLYAEGRRQLPALNYRSQPSPSMAHSNGRGSLNGNGAPRPASAYERGGYRRQSPASGGRSSSGYGYGRALPSQMAGLRLRSSPQRSPASSRPKGNLFSSLYDSHHLLFPHL